MQLGSAITLGMPAQTHRSEATASTPASPSTAEVSYNPQDKMTFGTSPISITTESAGKLSAPQVDFKSSPPAPQNGKYIYSDSDSRIHGALSFAAVAKTVETFGKVLGTSIPWSFHRQHLSIVPDGGKMLNAYYQPSDGTLNFFHATDPKTKSVLYSADSGEVVSHETGHAILDAMRPGYLQSFGSETRAYHEAFGDVCAIIMSLHDERTLDKLVEQTGGDLSKPNLVAAVGEDIGRVINNTAGQNVTGGNWVRNAINKFKWAKPSSLPQIGGPNQLGSEEHSFSRLWTGAMYDVLKGITDRNMATGQTPKDALRDAGDELLKVNANLFKTAPQGDFTFKQMAAACVKADQSYNGGKNATLMTKVFTDRKILGSAETEAAPMVAGLAVTEGSEGAPEGTKNIRLALHGDGFGMFEGAVVETPVDLDGSLTMSSETGERLRDSMKSLIAAGRIKYTEPGQKVSEKDKFDASGRPYVGIVRWLDGQMTIQPTRIAS